MPLGSRSCSVDGCDRPVKGRGWCSVHYQRWRRHGSPDVRLARGTRPQLLRCKRGHDRTEPGNLYTNGACRLCKVELRSVPAEPLGRCWCGATLPGRRRKYCSDLHAARGLRKGRPSTGALAAFLWTKICAEQVTQAEMARRLGVSAATVTNLLNGQRPRERTYRLLRVAFGEEVPPVVTETELARERCAANFTKLRAAAVRPDVVRRAAETRRGVKSPSRSAGVKAAVRRAREEGRPWPTNDLFAALALTRTLQGRAGISLGKRLKLCPMPNEATRRQWAREVGNRLDVPAETVSNWWKPALRARGIAKGPGRPRKDDRAHNIIAPLVADALFRSRSGRLPNGFWDKVATRVYEVENPSNPITADEVKRYWRRHRKGCASCRDMNERSGAVSG